MASSVPAELRKQAGIVGIRCSLALDDRDSADEFIRQLTRQFSQDPDVLFVIVHAYSDLSTRTAQDLGRTAPQSLAAHKLNAEALEMQGRWEPAQLEYEGIIQKDPDAPGIHFLLGRLFLSKPDAGPDAPAQRKKNFSRKSRSTRRMLARNIFSENLPGVMRNAMRLFLDSLKLPNSMRILRRPISAKDFVL